MTNKTTLKRLKLDPYFSKTIETNLNVWSHDQNSYEIKFEFYDHQCDKPIDLTGADMRILLDHADSKPKIYPLEIESKVLGLAKFIMPKEIRGCEGKFTAHIYADYPNKTHDFGSFTFYTQLSRIDGDLGGCMDEIYVPEFEKALEDIKEFKVDIDKNISDMKEHFDGRYNEAKTDVEEIEELIKGNNVATKNELGNLDDFREFDKDVISKMKNEFTERGVSPRWFGAKGDGETDDTKAIQDCVNYATPRKLPVRITSGVYMIKAHVDNTPSFPLYLENKGGVLLPSNTTVIFEEGAILKALPHKERASNVLRTYNSYNVKVINPFLVGNESSGKEFNYGMIILGGGNIELINARAEQFHGDGYNVNRSNISNGLEHYIPKNIIIKNMVSSDNGRQGISIEEVDGITVVDSEFTGSTLNNPKSGLDIEPSWFQEVDKTVCKNIKLKNCTFSNNDGYGLMVMGSDFVEDITIDSCYFYNNNLTKGRKYTNSITRCKKVAIKNTIFDDGETLQIAGVENFLMDGFSFKNGGIKLLHNIKDAVVRTGVFKFEHPKQGVYALHTERGYANNLDLILKDCLIDMNDSGTLEDPISYCVLLDGYSNFTSINNIFLNCGLGIRHESGNPEAISGNFKSMNDIFENTRSNAINIESKNAKIINPVFIGAGYEDSVKHNVSRDVSIRLTKKTGKVMLSGAYGTKTPSNEKATNKDLPVGDAVMLHVSGQSTETKIDGGNNISDYPVQNYYHTSLANNLLSSTAGRITTIHKPLSSYKEFQPNTLILILETNTFGYINQAGVFTELAKK